MTLDNVVELLLSYGLPSLPFLRPPEPQATPGVRATLRHTYEVTPPNTVKIVFENTAVKAIGPDLLQVREGVVLRWCSRLQVWCRPTRVPAHEYPPPPPPPPPLPP
jgi:hypothetical protein